MLKSIAREGTLPGFCGSSQQDLPAQGSCSPGGFSSARVLQCMVLAAFPSLHLGWFRSHLPWAIYLPMHLEGGFPISLESRFLVNFVGRAPWGSLCHPVNQGSNKVWILSPGGGSSEVRRRGGRVCFISALGVYSCYSYII